MTRRVENELEERRVIRLLDTAAADVPELGPAETAFLLAGARRRRRPGARRLALAAHRFRLLAPAAAVSAVAAAVLAGGGVPGFASHDERAPAAGAGVVVFPEASALKLLLSHRRTGAT